MDKVFSKDQFRPFHVDGRISLGADDLGLFDAALFGSKPQDVRVWQARAILNDFLNYGMSCHSGRGSTLWVVLAWLSVNKRSFHLDVPNSERNGYFVFLDAKPRSVV